jgi:cyclopropane fatty-acyl-phospholipid synthase-like methyltransferase
MGYFDRPENVKEYIKMAEGYDGEDLIKILRRYLEPGSSVLELGMGPGKDLDILVRDFKVTGSDISDVFLDLYRERNPEADLLKLDAVTLETDRKFDCIYSNKVLQHLTKDELRSSFVRQDLLLNDGGILLHTFWKGDEVEKIDDLLFVQYDEDELERIMDDLFEILVMETYTEMEGEDSIILVLKKKSD